MTKQIQFILNNKLVEVDFEKENLSPTTTVLNYLRNQPSLKGTKEGCAEGDCGACSVVLVESDGTDISYKAVDSCLMFLPMLHGKHLMTVEGIGCSSSLHKVQEAMVETDGSQCGYCTPGFISSLYALQQNTPDASREEIDDALTGNLCRCTGYRPIVEAAEIAVKNAKPLDNFDLQVSLNSIQKTETIEIDSNEQKYFKPFTLAEVLRLKTENKDSIIVNGGTDIGLLVTKRNEKLASIIDISAVEELQQIEESDTEIAYGAGLSLEKVRRHCKEHFSSLYDMLAVFGSRQIRELGTFGGNIANASPIGDTPPVLMSYGAKVELASHNGTRVLTNEEFVTGYRTTQLADNEIISKVIIPKLDSVRIYKSYKISKRKDLDISTVSAGFSVLLENNSVKEIDLFYGGMAAMTLRATKAEELLKGKEWSRNNIEQAMKLVDEQFTPLTDARSTKEGRTVMARNLLLKFWSETTV